MKHLGEKILEVRKLKGLTQEDLSESAGINLRTIQRIEKGDSEPRGRTLRSICDILDINFEEIYNYSKEEDNTYLTHLHLSVLSFIIIPLGNIFIPLILWLTKRNKILHVDKQGPDIINFQITWSFLAYTSIILYALFRIQHYPHSRLFFWIHLALVLVNIIYTSFTAIKMYKQGGEKSYYPFSIKIMKK